MSLEAGRFTIVGEHENAVVGSLPIYLLPVGTRVRGWGYEPDTRAALDWLAECVESGMTVADIGTGTGILAIAAARLGATVTAYEHNPAVREIAAENFALNGYDIELLGEYDGREGFDVVVANLGDDRGGPTSTAGRRVWTTRDFVAYGWAERYRRDEETGIVLTSGHRTETRRHA